MKPEHEQALHLISVGYDRMYRLRYETDLKVQELVTLLQAEPLAYIRMMLPKIPNGTFKAELQAFYEDQICPPLPCEQTEESNHQTSHDQ